MTDTVIRFDSGTTGQVKKLDNGFLQVPTTVGRVGVLVYRQPDGSERRELRHPDEVFHADSLATLASAVVTNDHPPRSAPDYGFVTSENSKRLSIGHNKNDAHQNDRHLDMTLVITDGDAIRQLTGGNKRQISPGYTTDLDFTPGVYNGERYDAIQRNIQYNHIAVVQRGRAGESVRLHLDSDALEVSGVEDKPKTQDEKPMAKLTIDSVDYDCPAQTQQAVVKDQNKRSDALKGAKDETAELQVKLDVAEAKAVELDKKIVELESQRADEADIRAAVKERTSLEATACKILGTEVKLDELDAADIKSAVVKKSLPALEEKLSEFPERLDAYFDAALIEADKVKKPAIDVARNRVDADVKLDEKSPEAAHAKMVSRLRNQHKKEVK